MGAGARKSLATAAALLSGAAAGSVIVKALPAPGRELTLTRPPWALTIRWTSEIC